MSLARHALAALANADPPDATLSFLRRGDRPVPVEATTAAPDHGPILLEVLKEELGFARRGGYHTVRCDSSGSRQPEHGTYGRSI